MLSSRLSWRRRRAAVLGATMAAAALVLFITAGPARADDVRNAQMWVLNAVGAPAAWKVSQGRGVTVAVIDSGVEPGVSDLRGSVTTGPDNTGVRTPEGNPNWGIHGTWMASLIAGHGHDGGGSGILGVAPKAHVLSIRVITDNTDPGYSSYSHEPQAQVQSELANAIRYAVSHRAGVISMSLGYGAPSLQVQEALQDAFSHGVVVVASTGNSGKATGGAHQGQAPYSFPADYLGVIGVAALNQNGAPAGFSSDNISVLVAAPGVDVPAQGRDGLYWLVSGTSPACALTAGVAALIKSAYPSLPADLVRKAIWSTTTRRPAGGYNEDVGFGTVNASAALAAAAQLSSGALAGPGAPGHGESHSARPVSTPAPGAAPAGTSPDSTASPGNSGARPASNTSQLTGGISAATHFGGGPQAVPPAPVGPRSPRQLVLLCLLAVASMAVIATTMSHLTASRRAPSRVAGRPGGPRPGGGGPGRTRVAMLPPPGLLGRGGAEPAPGTPAARDPAALPGPLARGGRVVSPGPLAGGGATPAPDPLAEGLHAPSPDPLPGGGAGPPSPRAEGAPDSQPGVPDRGGSSPLRRYPWSSRPPGRHAFPRDSPGAREPQE